MPVSILILLIFINLPLLGWLTVFVLNSIEITKYRIIQSKRNSLWMVETSFTPLSRILNRWQRHSSSWLNKDAAIEECLSLSKRDNILYPPNFDR